MELKNFYTAEPFSIKKGYDVLWSALHTVSLGKHRVPPSRGHWRFPELRKCTLQTNGEQGRFLTFQQPTLGNISTCIVNNENEACLQFFNSTLRYHICLHAEHDLQKITFYTGGRELFPALDTQGKPLIFQGPLCNLSFSVQGLSFLFVRAYGSNKELTLNITAFAPQRKEPRAKKVCLGTAHQKQALYTYKQEGRYYTASPSPELQLMYKAYQKARAKQSLPFPRNYDLQVQTLTQTGESIAVSFFNNSLETNSYLFTSSLNGKYVTNDLDGVWTGLYVPPHKKALLEFPELRFVYEASFLDEGDWEFVLEVGPVHHQSYYKSFSLVRTKTGYALPRIEIEDNVFSFHIANIGSAAGIVALQLGPDCQILLV